MRLGVCYYPEHWPESMWEDDARRMKALGIEQVRIAEFAWSRMEPTPGEYDWGWLDRAVDVLGAAGLLKGYRAATHWSAMDHLSPFGAIPTKTRVCVDRNRITGGGVTAGIDFALTLVSILVDRTIAEAIQLRLEYNPAPPFQSGSPESASPEVLALIESRMGPFRERRAEAVARAAARLNEPAAGS